MKSQTRSLSGFFDIIFWKRKEADEFMQKWETGITTGGWTYSSSGTGASMEQTILLLWCGKWLNGDRADTTARKQVAHHTDWIHLNNHDIISMPDKWESTLVCHLGFGFSLHQPEPCRSNICQNQLTLMTRVNGICTQWWISCIQRKEWDFNGVNPPTFLYGGLQYLRLMKKLTASYWRIFSGKVFPEIAIDFTWVGKSKG